MKRPFILAGSLAALALAVGACDGTGGVTVTGGGFFAAAPGAPTAPGSALSASAFVGTTNRQQEIAAGGIPAVVIIHPTEPPYPYGAP